jgi:hypothetical protein
MLTRDEVRANLQETSGVEPRFDPTRHRGLTALSTPASAVRATIDAAPASYVVIFACSTDLIHASSALAPHYLELMSCEGFAVFRAGSGP